MKRMHKTIGMLTVVSALSSMAACKTMRPDGSQLQSGGLATGELRGFANLGQHIRERIFDTNDFQTQQLEIEQTAGPGIAEVRFLLGAFSGSGERRQYANGQPNPLNVLLWHQIFAQLANRLGAKCDGDIEDDPRVTFERKLDRFFLQTEEAPGAATGTASDAQIGEAEPVNPPAVADEPVDPAGEVPIVGEDPFGSSSVSRISPLLHPTFARQLRDLCLAAAASRQPEASVLDGVWRRIMTDEVALSREAWKEFVGATFSGEGTVKEKVSDVLLGLLLDPEFLLER